MSTLIHQRVRSMLPPEVNEMADDRMVEQAIDMAERVRIVRALPVDRINTTCRFAAAIILTAWRRATTL